MNKQNLETTGVINTKEDKEMKAEVLMAKNSRTPKKLSKGYWLKSVDLNITKEAKGIRLVNELLNFYIWFGKFSWWNSDGSTGNNLDMAMTDLASDLQAHYDDLQLDTETKVEVEKALMLLTSIALKGEPSVAMLNNEYGELEVIGQKDEVMNCFEEYLESGLITVRQ